jgi:hypothetical protein
MTERLLTFIRSGVVDGVAVGARQDEVRSLLGPEEATSLTRDPIWRYGALQVAFHEGRVVWLMLSGEDHPDLAEVERWLAQEGLVYEVDPELTFEDSQTTLKVLGSGVRLVFDRESANRLAKAIVAEH